MTPLPPHLVQPATWGQETSADSYGIELSGNYSVSKWWRLQAQYTLFEMNVQNDPTSTFVGRNPCNQVYLRSSWDLREDLDFDIMARYVDRLANPSAMPVPSYISMDMRLAWRPRKHLEMAVVGQNLLQPQHLEFTDATTATAQVPRGVYGTLTWRH
jgi:iron complex outermembrane recepter protein